MLVQVGATSSAQLEVANHRLPNSLLGMAKELRMMGTPVRAAYLVWPGCVI
ncbi:MAG: hypothetical protein ACYDC5_07910 [Candidatus Dormibacteria bacterium]